MQLLKARAIANNICPDKDPETACMIIAAAIAGMRNLTMRHVRIGAMFWPDHFANAGDADMAVRGGWGVMFYSSSSGSLCLHEQALDDDGGFCGHTWLEPEPDVIVDLMHGVDGGEAIRCDSEFNVIARWIRRPKLERVVKTRWRTEMTAALAAGRAIAESN